jgi:hypothetical protein
MLIPNVNAFRLKLAWTVVLFSMSLLALPITVQAEVKILQTVWTDGINDKNLPRTNFQRTATSRSLYLWMNIKGRDRIVHKWYRYLGSRAYLDSEKTVEGTNRFVWSSKQNVQPGWWRVNVVYAKNNRPVICNNNRPCVYKIRVVK